MNPANVNLFRLLPPFRLRVAVHRITVRGFIEALRLCGQRVLASDLDLPKATPAQILNLLGAADLCAAVADLLVDGQRPRFFLRWASDFNARRIMRASMEAEGDEGWTRICSIVDWTGKRPKAGGGLMADVGRLCKIYPGLTPVKVLAMPMQDFLDECEFVGLANDAAAGARFASDPTLDPDAEPTPLSGLPSTGGAVH